MDKMIIFPNGLYKELNGSIYKWCVKDDHMFATCVQLEQVLQQIINLKKNSEHAVDNGIELAKVRMQRVMICKCISLTCHIQVALPFKANRTLISMIVSFYSIRGVGSYNNTYNSLQKQLLSLTCLSQFEYGIVIDLLESMCIYSHAKYICEMTSRRLKICNLKANEGQTPSNRY